MFTSCAFITGITGQVGSYLTEHLLEKSYVATIQKPGNICAGSPIPG